MVKLILFNPLAKVVGKKEFNYDAKTVKEALEMLVKENPDLEGRLFMKGELNKFINVYVNKQDIRYLKWIDTAIDENSEIDVMTALSGG